jgi:hypothetical protein
MNLSSALSELLEGETAVCCQEPNRLYMLSYIAVSATVRQTYLATHSQTRVTRSV